MPITYNTGTNTITVAWASGDSKGESFDNPYRLSDVLAADVAGSWGKVTGLNNSYTFNEVLFTISGSATHFVIESEHTYIINNVGANGALNFRVNSAQIRFNNWSCNYSMFKGNLLISCGSNDNYITNSIINLPYRPNLTGGPLKLENVSIITSGQFGILGNVEVKDVTIKGLHFGINTTNSNSVIQNLILENAIDIDTWNTGDGMTYRNIDCRGGGVRYGLGFQGYNRRFYIIDSSIRDNQYGILSTVGRDPGWVGIDFQSELILKLNTTANVELRDQNDNIIFSQMMEDGDSEVVTYSSVTAYDPSYPTQNIVINRFEPFKITISKEGYNDIIVENIYMTEDIGDGNRIGTLNPTILYASLFSSTLLINDVVETHCTTIGGSDGSINISATGGIEPYEYSIDDGNTWQPENLFEDLSADIYLVKVKDSDGIMTNSIQVEIIQPAPVYVSDEISASVEQTEINAEIEVEEITAVVDCAPPLAQ